MVNIVDSYCSIISFLRTNGTMTFCLQSLDDKKKLNATYIISVARKLGCSIFLLPEDIMQVSSQLQLKHIFA